MGWYRCWCGFSFLSQIARVSPSGIGAAARYSDPFHVNCIGYCVVPWLLGPFLSSECHNRALPYSILRQGWMLPTGGTHAAQIGPLRLPIEPQRLKV